MMLDQCQEWTGSRNSDGYGHQYINGQIVDVHRFIWEQVNQASLLPGAVVMHECDNPPCINPKHLKLGSHQLNMIDAARKGRLYNLPKNKAVVCIDTGIEYYSANEASRELKLTQSNITRVCNGQRKTVGGLRFAFKETP